MSTIGNDGRNLGRNLVCGIGESHRDCTRTNGSAGSDSVDKFGSTVRDSASAIGSPGRDIGNSGRSFC